MAKEKWKKCLKCKIFTDPNERYCPQYGKLEGHELREVWLHLEEILNLNSQRRLFTKHRAALEEKVSKQKRPT